MAWGPELRVPRRRSDLFDSGFTIARRRNREVHNSWETFECVGRARRLLPATQAGCPIALGSPKKLDKMPKYLADQMKRRGAP